MRISADAVPSSLAPLNWMNSLRFVGVLVALGRYFPSSIRIAKLPVSIGSCPVSGQRACPPCALAAPAAAREMRSLR